MINTREAPTAAAILQNRDFPESQRVEACHALGRSTTPEAIEALIEALDDRSFSVRYAASEALILHGQPGVERLLRELESNTDPRLYESALHVLKRLPGPGLREAVQPVTAALDDAMMTAYVPIAARQALQAL